MHTLPGIIRNPSEGQSSKSAVMDGIIHSSMLTPEQRQLMDGIVSSALPAGAKTHRKQNGSNPALIKVGGAPATSRIPGIVQLPGVR